MTDTPKPAEALPTFWQLPLGHAYLHEHDGGGCDASVWVDNGWVRCRQPEAAHKLPALPLIEHEFVPCVINPERYPECHYYDSEGVYCNKWEVAHASAHRAEPPTAEPKNMPRESHHAATCAVPNAFFVDDKRCTCGLREAVEDAFYELEQGRKAPGDGEPIPGMPSCLEAAEPAREPSLAARKFFADEFHEHSGDFCDQVWCCKDDAEEALAEFLEARDSAIRREQTQELEQVTRAADGYIKRIEEMQHTIDEDGKSQTQLLDRIDELERQLADASQRAEQARERERLRGLLKRAMPYVRQTGPSDLKLAGEIESELGILSDPAERVG